MPDNDEVYADEGPDIREEIASRTDTNKQEFIHWIYRYPEQHREGLLEDTLDLSKATDVLIQNVQLKNLSEYWVNVTDVEEIFNTLKKRISLIEQEQVQSD